MKQHITIVVAALLMTRAAFAQDDPKVNTMTGPTSLLLQTGLPIQCKATPTYGGEKPVAIVAIFKSGDGFVYLCKDNHTDANEVVPNPIDGTYTLIKSIAVIFTKYRQGAGSDPCIRVTSASGLDTTICW